MITWLSNMCARLQPRAAAVLLVAAVGLAACGSSGERPPIPDRIGGANGAPAGRQGGAPVDNVMTPPHLADQADDLVRVGLLLPSTAPQASLRAEAASMFNAASLALFEAGAGRIVLIPKDTGGTADGARTQAREALRAGADIILGPLLADEVRAVAQEAKAYGKPVLAFSNDQSVAQDGAYLLSVTPEEEIWRMVGYASRQGLITYATLTPDDSFGLRVRDAAEAAAQANGAFLVTWEMYPAGSDATTIDQAAKRLARYDARQAAERAGQKDQFELPYDSVILPAGGVELLSVAPLLPYYDVKPSEVKFLGTGRWQDGEVAREPALAGGWFPGPDSAAHAAFVEAYRRTYRSDPTRLAPLAYDGVMAIASLTRGLGAAGLTEEGFERPTGFRGADGLFRFHENHLAEHGLAIYEVRNGQFQVVEPAPQSFAPAAF